MPAAAILKEVTRKDNTIFSLPTSEFFKNGGAKTPTFRLLESPKNSISSRNKLIKNAYIVKSLWDTHLYTAHRKSNLV
jgi:hypothetical protein